MLDKATWQEATQIVGRVGIELSIVNRDKQKFEEALDLEILRMRDDMVVAFGDWLQSTDA